MKTVYFHIGTSKTGTSAIQAFLDDNSNLLAQKGYCYQRMPFSSVSRANPRRNAHFLVECIIDSEGNVDENATEERIREGYKVIENWVENYDSVILTDESFWNGMQGKKWEVLERLKAFLDEKQVELKIIVYLRNQDEYMASWWKQSVRSGRKVDSWENFMRNPKGLLLNYSRQLECYGNLVGKENLIVRRYERERFRGDKGTIFSDFMDAIGLDYSEEYFIREERVNISLTDNCAEIKRILNNLQMGSKVFESSALNCSKLENGKTKYSLYSREEQLEIWKRYESSNEAVRREYFPEDEQLFTRKEMQLEKWNPDNEKMREDIILFFGMTAAKQQEENDELQIRLRETNARQRELEKRIRELESEYKKSRGEIRALILVLKPIKWIWRKLHPKHKGTDER